MKERGVGKEERREGTGDEKGREKAAGGEIHNFFLNSSFTVHNVKKHGNSNPYWAYNLLNKMTIDII